MNFHFQKMTIQAGARLGFKKKKDRLPQ